MMTELDVVNDQLATMAESPVTSLNIRHPFIAGGLQRLKRASEAVQAQRWWFKCITIEVTPAPTTFLIDSQLPCGTIAVWADNPLEPVTWRDGQLLSLKTWEVVEVLTKIVVHFEVPFLDLPLSANLAIGAKAVLDFQTLYDGDSTKSAALVRDADTKLRLMTAEHMRVMKVNLLNRKTTAHARFRVRGPRPYVVN